MCVYSKMFIYHHHYPIKHRRKKSLIMNITQKILVINVGPAAQKFCCVASLCNVISRFEHFVFCILFVEDQHLLIITIYRTFLQFLPFLVLFFGYKGIMQNLSSFSPCLSAFLPHFYIMELECEIFTDSLLQAKRTHSQRHNCAFMEKY